VENRLKFLKENLEREHQKLNYITLYVWVGTCNLTTKEGNYIYLTAKDHTAVDDIKKRLREIYSFTREFGNRVKLVFLHLPLYSIVQFNLYNEYEGDMTDYNNNFENIKHFMCKTHNYSTEFGSNALGANCLQE